MLNLLSNILLWFQRHLCCLNMVWGLAFLSVNAHYHFRCSAFPLFALNNGIKAPARSGGLKDLRATTNSGFGGDPSFQGNECLVTLLSWKLWGRDKNKSHVWLMAGWVGAPWAPSWKVMAVCSDSRGRHTCGWHTCGRHTCGPPKHHHLICRAI